MPGRSCSACGGYRDVNWRVGTSVALSVNVLVDICVHTTVNCLPGPPMPEMYMTATRISPKDHERLQRLALKTGQSHQEVIGRALESYERECMLDALNESFARLRLNKEAWDEELAERAGWDSASADFGGDS